jgi:NAD(P)-dependent dehydrogenase (short-subunit alcohol dehydrogenase family)
MRLAGKVALVVGGGGGIGRAIAVRFAREGTAGLCVADVDEAAGLKTVREIEANGNTAYFARADASQADEAAALVRSVMETAGGLHVLVNSMVKYPPPRNAVDLSDDDWDLTMTSAPRSYFLMAKHAIPAIVRSGGGSIVNISSISGMVSSVGNVAYVAAKGATTALTKSLATDFARHGVRVNAVCPGVIATPRIAARFLDTPENAEAVNNLYPLGRCGTPDDVAWAALFLASDEASWVTGTTLVVDGGLTGAMPGIAVVPEWRERWLQRPAGLS